MSYDVLVSRDVDVPMRDGVDLAADVYRPAGEGRWPVLLHRLRVSKSKGGIVGGLMINPLEAARQGYAVVIQDIRGRYASEGLLYPFVNEANDGYDSVEWAAGQPWSNGDVGIYGSSYMGVTTWQTVLAQPPHLRAAVAYVTGADYHEGWTYSGGALELGWSLWWTWSLLADTLGRPELTGTAAEKVARLVRDFSFDPWPLVRRTPLRQALDGLAPYWDEWLDHPAYDEFWERFDVVAHADRVSVPVLQVAAIADQFYKGHIDAYRAVTDKAQPAARESHRLVIGPWDHEAYTGMFPSRNGDIECGPEAVSNEVLSRLTFDWFSRWLKQETVPEMPRVRYFMTGDFEWRDSADWPPPCRSVAYYLHSAGQANSRLGDGSLSTEAPGAEPADSYAYDPADPVPTVGGRVLMPAFGTGGARNQAQVELREDILCYTTPLLASRLSVAGPVTLKLYIASSAVDTDYTAKLVDVYPDGFCANIAEGILRARYRDSRSEQRLLSPGEPTELTVDLWDACHSFLPGHRVRLEVSSSNFPRFDRNFNVAATPATVALEDGQVAIQQVFHDAARPSCLLLPAVSS